MPTNLITHFRNNRDLPLRLVQAIAKHWVDFDFNPGQKDQPNYGVFDTLFYSKDALLSHDEKGIINFYNLAAQKIFGYTPEEAIGMASEELVPEELKEERSKELDALVNLVELQTRRLAKGQKPININALVFPYELQEGIYVAAARVELIGLDSHLIKYLGI